MGGGEKKIPRGFVEKGYKNKTKLSECEEVLNSIIDAIGLNDSWLKERAFFLPMFLAADWNVCIVYTCNLVL